MHLIWKMTFIKLFHKNVLDWSINNVIGIALKDLLYFFKNSVKENNVVEVDRHQDSFYTALKFSKNGSIVACGDLNGGVAVFDVETAKLISQQKHEIDRITCLGWRDENTFTSGCINGKINSIDMRTRDFVGSYKSSTSGICNLSWAKDEHLLCSGGNDNNVIIWDHRK